MPDPSDHSPAPLAAPPELAATNRPADRYGFLVRAGGRTRYACWNASGTRGSVVLLQGRAEFIEKYGTEVVGELLERGFAVYAVDLRGQGLSDRTLPEHDKGHIDDFATYVADLDQFLNEVVAPQAPRPILGLSHSTSGNILLRWLAEHGPGPLASSFFVSPMTAIARGLTIEVASKALSPFELRDSSYMVATGPYDPKHRNFASNDVTHDERRYRFTDQWFAADPRLRLGGPTIGWLRQAFRSIDILNQRGYLERITIPVGIVSAGQDEVVDAQSHGPVVARLKDAKHVVVEGAKHEILMELDPLRAKLWAAFDAFTADSLRA